MFSSPTSLFSKDVKGFCHRSFPQIVVSVSLKNFQDGFPINNVGHDDDAPSSPPVVSRDPSVKDIRG